MRRIGQALLWLGLFVGLLGGAGLMLAFHGVGLAWLVGVGLAKLTLAAAGGLMAGGATLQRLAKRADEQKHPRIDATSSR